MELVEFVFLSALHCYAPLEAVGIRNLYLRVPCTRMIVCLLEKGTIK